MAFQAHFPVTSFQGLFGVTLGQLGVNSAVNFRPARRPDLGVYRNLKSISGITVHSDVVRTSVESARSSNVVEPPVSFHVPCRLSGRATHRPETGVRRA